MNGDEWFKAVIAGAELLIWSILLIWLCAVLVVSVR